MKKVWYFLKNFIVIAYILLIIFVTICLLSYNKYKVTVFGNSTLLPIIDEELEPNYTVGDLLIINKNNLSSVQEGDVIFFYRTIGNTTNVNYATVTQNLRVNDTETTFTVEGGYNFSSSYFIGKASTATVIPKVGKVLQILESKWGFLLLGVFPSLIAFLYTGYSIFIEMQEADEPEEDIKKKKKKKNRKENKEEIKETEKNVTEEEKEDVKEEKKVEQNKKDDEIKKEKNEDLTNVDDTKNVDVAKKETNEVKENSEEKDKKEETITSESKESITEEKINETKEESKTQTAKKLTEEEKKALIEAKLKSMTEEEKKALIEAKLKSMTDEQKRALIEAKKKKMEAEKNNK